MSRRRDVNCPVRGDPVVMLDEREECLWGGAGDSLPLYLRKTHSRAGDNPLLTSIELDSFGVWQSVILNAVLHLTSCMLITFVKPCLCKHIMSCVLTGSLLTIQHVLCTVVYDNNQKTPSFFWQTPGMLQPAALFPATGIFPSTLTWNINTH